ncbi:hypothetical protein MC7420_5023, partial [Coleofasciculus chthonoplastes PCC 7420]
MNCRDAPWRVSTQLIEINLHYSARVPIRLGFFVQPILPLLLPRCLQKLRQILRS